MTNSTLTHVPNRIPVRSVAKVRRLKAQGKTLNQLAALYNTTVWQVRRVLAD